MEKKLHGLVDVVYTKAFLQPMDESNEIVVRIVQLDRILSVGSDFIHTSLVLPHRYTTVSAATISGTTTSRGPTHG